MESKQRAELLGNTDNHARDLLTENASLSFDMVVLYGRHEFKEIFDQLLNKSDTDPVWFMDQVLCTMMITDYSEKHPNFNLSYRGRIDRLDRGKEISFWDRDQFDEFGDAHLIQDKILEEGNWKIFNKLLKYLFNETLVTLFNDYYKQYMTLD